MNEQSNDDTEPAPVCFDGCGKPTEDYEVDDGNARCWDCAVDRESLVARERKRPTESIAQRKGVIRAERDA